ncbi:MAG: aspartyl/asparaginyl beta-hydroxylase domain-containing protein [Pirellulales bacterium]
MDYHVFKSLLNQYLSRHVGGEKRPVFVDIEATCPELMEITAAFPRIQAEFDRVLAAGREIPRYHDVDPGEAKISATSAEKWSVYMLDVIGHKPEENRALCPETCALLAKVPGLMQAFFSILDPGKSIPQHNGPYLGYLRYHLGLRVPRHAPPTLWIADQPYTWRDGEAVMFDDSWPHRVDNQALGLRGVLIIDIMRPLPLVPAIVNRLTTKVIGRHTYGRHVAERVRRFKEAA